MYYSHIWFDLGMTLVSTNRAENYKNVLRDFGINKSVEEIEIAYHLADKLFMREYRGILGKGERIFLPWYLGVLNYKLGVEIDLYELLEALNKIKSLSKNTWKTYEYSIAVIKKLRNLGLKVGLISNWDLTCRKILKENSLLELFDTVIISSEVGFLKPSKQIFDYAMKEAGADYKKSIYIGDNYYDDVVGAAEVGMKCLLINPYKKIGIEEINYPYVIKDIRDVFKYLNKPL